VLILASTAFSQSLSTEEKRIAAHIDAHMSEAITLLERVVNINSATQNIAGVKSIGDVFKTEFEALGLTAKWLDMPVEMRRAGHLLAETNGSRGKRLLLIGHIDTVLENEGWRRDGKRGFGSGSSDMKGGDVVLLYALKALASVGALKDTRIIVMLTGDEESVGRPVETSRASPARAYSPK